VFLFDSWKSVVVRINLICSFINALNRYCITGMEVVAADKFLYPSSFSEYPILMTCSFVCGDVCFDWVGEAIGFNCDLCAEFGFGRAAENAFGEEIKAARSDVQIAVFMSC